MKIIVFILLFLTASAQAQDRPGPEVKGTAGWVGFIDEDFLDHGVVGGSVRYYLTPRVGVEPEVLFMFGPGSDRDVTVVPQVTFDFMRDPRGRKVRPYLIGGAGWLHHSRRFGPFEITENEWVMNGGIGVKIFLTPRLFVAPEFRLGFATIVRATGSIGFAF